MTSVWNVPFTWCYINRNFIVEEVIEIILNFSFYSWKKQGKYNLEIRVSFLLSLIIWSKDKERGEAKKKSLFLTLSREWNQIQSIKNSVKQTSNIWWTGEERCGSPDRFNCL